MSWVDTIPPADATGNLARLYRRAQNADGTVDAVVRVHSLNPRALDGHLALYTAVLKHDSPLSPATREMLGVVVSAENGCHY